MNKQSMADIRRQRQAQRSLRFKRSLASALTWLIPIGLSAYMIVYAYGRFSAPAPDQAKKPEVALAYESNAKPEALPETEREQEPLGEQEPFSEWKPKRRRGVRLKPVPNPAVVRLERKVARLERAEAKRKEDAAREAEPEAKPKPVELTPAQIELAKRQAELLALRATVAMHRKAREPKKLLNALKELKRLQPEDPDVHFGLGEVYGSNGSYDRKKAREAFREFRRLTKPLGDARRKPAKEYLKLLDAKQQLYLATPHAKLATVKADRERRIANLERDLRKNKGDRDRSQAYLAIPNRQKPKNNLNGHHKLKLQDAKAKIRQGEQKIAPLTAELERIKEALQQADEADK